MKQKVLLMLPCIAAVAIATFVGKKTLENNAYESNAFLAQNVEALSQNNGDLRSLQDQARYIQTSQGLLVTNITGSIEASVHLNLSVGKLVDDGLLDIARGAGLTITTKSVKTYRESCFYKKGSNCACIETDWRPCEGSCPKSFGTN